MAKVLVGFYTPIVNGQLSSLKHQIHQQEKKAKARGKCGESKGNGYDSSETEVNTLLCVQRQGKVKRKSA